MPKLTGCYTIGARCSCIGQDGRPVQLQGPMCKLSASSFDGLVRWEPRASPPPPPASSPPTTPGLLNGLRTAVASS